MSEPSKRVLPWKKAQEKHKQSDIIKKEVVLKRAKFASNSFTKPKKPFLILHPPSDLQSLLKSNKDSSDTLTINPN